MPESRNDGANLARIGRIGELNFNILCLRAKLECSAAVPDMTGKDFVVESKLEDLAANRDGASIDNRAPPLQVVVQLKTIFAKNEEVRLSLSVAERLAKDTRPAVLAISRVDSKDRPVELYFLHLIDDQLARILKALRRASSENASLNKKDITFRTTHAARVSSDPDEFRTALFDLAKEGMLDYSTRKSQQLRELGFTPNRFNLRFEIPKSSPGVVNGLLGLEPVEVHDLVVNERRFSIDLPIATSERTMINIVPPTCEGIMTVYRGRYKSPEYVMLKANYAVAPPANDGHDWGVLAQTKYGDVLLRPDHWGFRRSEDYAIDRSHVSHDWTGFFKLAAIVDSCDFTIRCENNDGSPPFRFELFDPSLATDISEAQEFLELVSCWRPIEEALGLQDEPFALADLRVDRDAIKFIGVTMQHVTASFDFPSEEPYPDNLVQVRSAFASAVQLLGAWVGIFIPVAVSTASVGTQSFFNARQTLKTVIEPLGSSDIERSFELFVNKYGNLAGIEIALVQNPGDFLSGRAKLVDLQG